MTADTRRDRRTHHRQAGDREQRPCDSRLPGRPQGVARGPGCAAASQTGSVLWERRRLDGAPGYSLSIEVARGAIAGGEARPIELTPDAEGELHLRVTALTGDAPLRPFEEDALVTSAAAPDARLRHMLAFLSYEQKLLAGSWRFNTYFGRDTLMSLRLLAPVLRPRGFRGRPWRRPGASQPRRAKSPTRRT